MTERRTKRRITPAAREASAVHVGYHRLEHIPDARGIVDLGHLLQHWGFHPGEHPAFGGVHCVHVPGSYHYEGCALDINCYEFPLRPPVTQEVFHDEPHALNWLYGRLLHFSRENPVELLFEYRLWHGRSNTTGDGYFFTNAELSASHMNHLHVAYRPPYGGPHGFPMGSPCR